jgi:hypothetical protein
MCSWRDALVDPVLEVETKVSSDESAFWISSGVTSSPTGLASTTVHVQASGGEAKFRLDPAIDLG